MKARWAIARRCYSSAVKTITPQPIRFLLASHMARNDPTNAEIKETSPIVQIVGFARSIRTHRKLTFINLTDGSLPADDTLQAVIKGDSKDKWDSQLSLGVALQLTGRLQQSKGRDQLLEFAVEELQVTGQSNASTYPLASIADSSPTSNNVLLRKNAHLRPRDPRHAAVLRSRSRMERALSDYFDSNDFVRVTAPIITSSDCEGGGEVFQVDSIDGIEEGSDPLNSEIAQEPSLSGSTPDQPSRNSSIKKASFFSNTPAYLTVSSQLHLEALALGLGRVYTVGPSFRAESSATNRHLAEFWMCEGEMLTSNDATIALEQVMSVVEGLLKQIMTATLKSEESRYLWAEDEPGLSEITGYSDCDWPRMTYTEAIDALQQEGPSNSSIPVKWGDSLASEHERWLARDGPIFITHYPASTKPFYMRQDGEGTDRATAACFDLLVPRIGELVGGSLREERRDHLAARPGASSPHLQWYVDDLRKFGCNPHGGFGLGMERLVSFLTKTDNLRDCLTFPRVKGPVRY
jgi:asparaginyl-tRNA synthetase